MLSRNVDRFESPRHSVNLTGSHVDQWKFVGVQCQVDEDDWVGCGGSHNLGT